MNRFLCIALSVALVLSGVPSAFASEADPAYSLEVCQYGYTDQGITVATLAEDWGCSPGVVLAVGAMVDTWSQGNGAQRFSASQLANVASGVKEYMRQAGSWDGFVDTVEGLTDIAGQVFFDARPWWDMLGFSSLAEDRSFARSGYRSLSSMLRPSDSWVSTSITPSGWGPLSTAALWSILLDPYPAIQIRDSGTDTPFRLVNNSDHQSLRGGYVDRVFVCLACIEEGANPSGGALFETRTGFTSEIYGNFFHSGSNVGTAFSLSSALQASAVHLTTHNIESEAATVVKALTNSGLPGFLALSMNAITNPGGTVLNAVDAWGVPKVIPPGAIHEGLEPIDGVGRDLSMKADQLASIAASMTAEGAGVLSNWWGTMLGGLADILDWFANLGSTIKGWFVPDSDYLKWSWTSQVNRFKEFSRTRFPFSILPVVREFRDQLGGM